MADIKRPIDTLADQIGRDMRQLTRRLRVIETLLPSLPTPTELWPITPIELAPPDFACVLPAWAYLDQSTTDLSAYSPLDLQLACLDYNFFDLQLSNSVDLVTDATLNTAIVISLFTDRYDSTLNKGGWWGDERADNPYPLGSRLWTLSKNKVDSQTLLSAEDYAREALQWMLHDNLLKSLTINAKWERAKTETITYRIALLIEATTHPTSHYAKSFNTRYLL